MLNQKSIKITTRVMTLVTLALLSFPNIGLTQTTNTNNDGNSNEEEESIVGSIPDRRKGGASRSLTTPQDSKDDENNENEEIVQAPQRRKPAASRNDSQCNFNPQELVALIPENLQGKTTTSSPTLYFSVPAIAANIEIEFVLRGPQDELIEKQTFSGKGRAGIMGLKLGAVPDVSTTNPNSSYHWYLSVICNQGDRADDIVVEGLLQPVVLDSNQQQQLATATSEQRIQLYETHDLWHEKLDALATIKRSQPQDYQASQELRQLLQSVRLDPSIGEKPLLDTQILSLNH
ncbi:DUF928 domain-containing protein [Crocosphaera sp. Alani8]|uniref:DUF928 domain-containing protein n=1 Tax=Crocosphaera sp. Alani8 TaxID=3038952 RepID=UPI00313E0CF8